MFIYQYNDNHQYVFKAINNAALCIATMWDSDLIDSNLFVVANQHIIIHLTNPREFDFVNGKAYHLMLKTNYGQPYIYMALDHWQYVAVYYRMSVENANSLFQNNPKYIDESIYYNDDIEF